MFGKPAWFRAKKNGWGLVPVRFQGWVYAALWCVVIAAPFLLLTERHQAFEAMVWLAFGLGALAYDVRQILRDMHAGTETAARVQTAAASGADDGILYILDSGPVATRNYNLRLK